MTNPVFPREYEGDCSNCGGHLHLTLLSGQNGNDGGRWVRFGACVHINLFWSNASNCDRSDWRDEDKCPWLVDEEDPRVIMV